MQCQQCQSNVKSTWKFCPNCGNEHKSPSGSYGSGVRAQVLEVVVRQAIGGAPWKEICAGPMQVNRISEQEVEEEVRRRLGGDEPPASAIPLKPSPAGGTGSIALAAPIPSQQLSEIRAKLLRLAADKESDDTNRDKTVNALIDELDSIAKSVKSLEQLAHSNSRAESEAQLQTDLERERDRIKQQFRTGNEPGPHHITWT